MIAGVCWTPFQIINCINYKLQYAPNELLDLYICRKFSGAEEITEKLSHLHYINNVYSVKELDYDHVTAIKRKLNIVKDLFCVKSVLKKCILDKINFEQLNYKYIISSGYLNFNIYFCNYFRKKGTKLYFIDDGIESYLKENTIDTYSKFYKFFSELTGNGGTKIIPEKLFVYNPNLVQKDNVYSLQSLKKLDGITKQDLNWLFDYEKNFIIPKCMVFDQIGTGDFKNGNCLLKKQNEILKYLEEKIGMSNILIKLHPRTNKSIYDSNYKVADVHAPWEIFNMNVEMTEKILVSLSSSACLSPKLIFDEEPIVIFLYKLFDLDRIEILEELFFKVKKQYTDPDRLFVPKSLDELHVFLERISERK